MKRKVTSHDVARLAGVSQASVSRAFSAKSSVSPEKREKILQAAQQLNYVPNAMAQALTSKHSNCIAIVQPIAKNPYFYTQILQNMLELLHAADQRVLLFSQDDKNIDEILPLIDQYQVDGVIIASATIDVKKINHYVDKGIAFSFVNRPVPNVAASSISTDNQVAAMEMVSYLAEQGYRRLMCIAGDENASTALERVSGYTFQTGKLGLDNLGIDFCNFSVQGGYQAACKLLDSGAELPDAIICGNDEVAIGVINALNERNLQVPQDIAVTGFDDIDAASWPGYQLTTYRQPVRELCELAVQELLSRIRNDHVEPSDQKLTGHLIPRRSA